MKAIILAAGKGERFYPFSHFRPKPMFPICNRPLLEWTIQRLVNVGLTEIGIVVGHNKGRIKNHFADGTRFGCTLSYIEQPQQRGTADAICAAATFIGQDDFFVLHGDVFFGPNTLSTLQTVFETSEGNGVAGTSHTDHIEHHTRANISAQNQITAYTWKPRGGSGFALAGLYAFRNRALQDLACASDFPPGVQNGVVPPQSLEIADTLPLMFREGRPVTAVELTGPWFDMDMPWHPRAVSRLAVEEMASQLTQSHIANTAQVDPNAHITGNVFIDEGVRIAPSVHINGPVWIGKNTHIHEGSQIASHTVIGEDCRIGPFAKVSGMVDRNNHITFLGEFGGIILAGGRITHQMQISGIYGEGAEFGAGTQVGTLRFDDGPTQVEVKGIRHNAPGFSGALFGDYARTGVGAILMPGRIIGPGAMVGPGVVLMKNVPPFKAVLVQQQLKEIDWSPNIYDR